MQWGQGQGRGREAVARVAVVVPGVLEAVARVAAVTVVVPGVLEAALSAMGSRSEMVAPWTSVASHLAWA